MNENNFINRLSSGLSMIFGKKNRWKGWFNENYSQVNKGSLYINTQVPYEVYNSLSEVNIPIDKVASMLSNGVFMLEDEKTLVKESLPKELETLLKQPNILQSQNEWLKQYAVQLQLHGNQFIYKNKPSALLSVPKALFNIDPSCIKPVLTGKIYDQVEISGIIKHYELDEDGKTRPINTDTVIWSKIGDANSPLLGKSKLKSLKWPISNTDVAYQYLNSISGEKGAIGALSREPSKDSMGELPVTPEEKIESERLHRQIHGVEEGQSKLLITSNKVSWSPFSYPTAQLQLREQITDNFSRILSAFGVNVNLFINSTYDNLIHGLKSTHNDTVVPLADGLCQKLTSDKDFSIPKGKRLILDYTHLPYLQPDKVAEAATFASVSAALKVLVDGTIILPQEAKIRLENQFGKVEI